MNRPLVVGTLTNQTPVAAQLVRAKAAGVDLIEVRLDTFAQSNGPFQKVYEFGRNVLREIKTKTKLPVLLTFRATDERGAAKPRLSKNEDSRRAEILARLLPSVQMVDVEIAHAAFARKMTVIAHVHGVQAVHSTHDFGGPGRFARLNALSARSLKFKGDVFKVAVTPRTNQDLEKFLRWGLSLKNPRRVLIGMGKTGLPSRVVGYSFGSLLTYGHLGRSAAPGQMAAADLVKTIRAVYGAH